MFYFTVFWFHESASSQSIHKHLRKYSSTKAYEQRCTNHKKILYDEGALPGLIETPCGVISPNPSLMVYEVLSSVRCMELC